MLFILGKYWATLYRGLTVEPRLSPSTFVYFVKIVELQHVASRDDVALCHVSGLFVKKTYIGSETNQMDISLFGNLYITI